MSGSPIMSGRFNKRISLQQDVLSQDAAGQNVRTYSTVATVWAAMEPSKGEEFEESQKYVNEVLVKIRIRFRTDVKATWRISLNETATSPATTRVFGILGIINPLEGRRELHLICRELPYGEPV